MGSPREHLARVSYFPGVRAPRDEEAHPTGESDRRAAGGSGWHVEGTDDYLDEVTPPGATEPEGAAELEGGAGPEVVPEPEPEPEPERAGDPDARAVERYFQPEPLSPRHPAGKGRPAAARGSLTALPRHDDARESDAARADRERSGDPRLVPAMERMARLLEAVEPAQPAARGGWTRDAAAADEAPECDDDALAARAERISMHALTRRGVSTSELRRTLTSRDLPEHIVEAELARLARVGLLDDTELARTLVRTLTERKRLGRSALIGELRRRGLDSEAIELALDDLDGDDEASRADELAQKRAPQLRSLDRVTAERRLLGFLQRKGYSGSVAQAAVRKALGQSSSGVRFE